MNYDNPGLEYLEKCAAACDVFVSTTSPDGTTKKRDDHIRREYGNTYHIQLEMTSVIRKLDVSLLLGCNDCVIPHMIEEYAQLRELGKMLIVELKKGAAIWRPLLLNRFNLMQL